MTDDAYELDAMGAPSADDAAGDEDETVADSLGVAVPETHVAAFVAEAFEDAERDTTWSAVVDRVVAEGAHEAWDALSPREQAAELLTMADDFDARAVEALAAIPLDEATLTGDGRDRFEEAMRCRRNADRIRDGVADGFANGHLSDDDLVGAVECAGFDTDAIAEREDRLESVAAAYDVDFRPYGGTLMDDAGGDGAVPEGEVW
jgi:hypothetical protein